MSPGAHPALGIALILCTAACFAAMDTTVRYLGRELPVLLLLTARYAFQAAAMALWLAADRRRGFRSAHPRFQAVRGTLLLLTSATSFLGLQFLPVPEFTSINMLTPVLVTLLAAVVLHEPVSGQRWALVGLAFVGALVVIRPGSGLFGWAVLFPLTGAMFYAAFQVLTSRMAALESPYTTHFWTGFTGAAVMLPVLAAGPADVCGTLAAMTARQWGLMLAIGALGTGGHLMLILAMGMAPTATLMPFIYTQIAAAAGFAWAVFGHLPDRWAWAGMGIIALAGASSAWLNMRRRPPPPVEADTIAE